MPKLAQPRMSLVCSALLALATGVPAGAAPAMLPDRTLRCTLGRVTNFDPQGHQTPVDLRYEGQHAFALFLPGGPRRTTLPPDPTEPADPVDPRTRVVADPDGLRRSAANRFDRVVDFWPDRVEMTTAIDGPLVNLIVVHPIDAAHGTANLFMTQATDLTGFDVAHLFQGQCKVETAATR